MSSRDASHVAREKSAFISAICGYIHAAKGLCELSFRDTSFVEGIAIIGGIDEVDYVESFDSVDSHENPMDVGLVPSASGGWGSG